VDGSAILIWIWLRANQAGIDLNKGE